MTRARVGWVTCSSAALTALMGWAGCKPGGAAPSAPADLSAVPGAAGSATASPAEPPAAKPPEVPALGSLQARLVELAARAGGTVGIAVLHVESGRSVSVGAEHWLPLQSVYKLPLAVAVARAVQAGRVSWEQTMTVTAADRVPGAAVNQARWQELPRAVSVRGLLEHSLVESDNISSAKLVGLLGGRAALVEQMRALGFEERVQRAPTPTAQAGDGLPYHAPALRLARLLAGLQRGEVLPAAQRDVLWEMMRRARTGERRLRAGVPVGTPVLEKTGTGRGGSVTNDVGLITLPGSAGHLALAVLMAGSPLPSGAQEDLIAEVARTAFLAFAPSP